MNENYKGGLLLESLLGAKVKVHEALKEKELLDFISGYFDRVGQFEFEDHKGNSLMVVLNGRDEYFIDYPANLVAKLDGVHSSDDIVRILEP